jgi:hypothetical protein
METNTNSVEQYSEVAAQLRVMQFEFANKVYDRESSAGIKEVRVDRSRVVKSRTTLEKIRVAIKAEPFELCKRIDAQAKAIKDAHLEIEKPLTEIIEADELRIASARAEKNRAEGERLRIIQVALDGLRFGLTGHNSTEEIAARVLELKCAEITEAVFQEQMDAAEAGISGAMEAARSAWRIAKEREDREVKRAEFDAEVARVQRAKAQELAAKENEIAQERIALAKEKEEFEAGRRAAKAIEEKAARDAERDAALAMEAAATERLEKSQSIAFDEADKKPETPRVMPCAFCENHRAEILRLRGLLKAITECDHIDRARSIANEVWVA